MSSLRLLSSSLPSWATLRLLSQSLPLGSPCFPSSSSTSSSSSNHCLFLLLFLHFLLLLYPANAKTFVSNNFNCLKFQLSRIISIIELLNYCTSSYRTKIFVCFEIDSRCNITTVNCNDQKAFVLSFLSFSLSFFSYFFLSFFL